MDLLTQGLLGAALSQSIAKQNDMRLATFIGSLAGLLADTDALIANSNDPLLTIEFHRHFTHSIFFIPIGALIAALILWPFLKQRLASGNTGFKRLYLYTLAGYSLSGFIDACTSYGTHLFWPLSNERVSFNIISIIDPVFTGALIIAVIWAWKSRQSRASHLALLFCGLYLTMGAFQHQRAISLAENIAHTRGHNIEKLVVKPTLGNIILWRSTYISRDRIYVDALRLSTNSKVYRGDSVALFNPERDAREIPVDSVLYADILRFTFFSDGFLAFDNSRNDLLGDVRYSMLPNSTSSMWGITLNRKHPELHAKFDVYRNNSASTRATFISQLLGE